MEWNQDFGTYHRVDGIPEARGTIIDIFLNGVTPCNATVLAIPGSHKDGLFSEAIIDENVVHHSAAAKFCFDITDDTLSHLVNRKGIKSLEGLAGTMLLMNMAVVHGSSVNISPLRPYLLYVKVSAVDNRGKSFARQWYYAARNFNPLVELGQDCRLSYYKTQ